MRNLAFKSRRTVMFWTFSLIVLMVATAPLAEATLVRFAKPTAYPSGGGWLESIAVADLNGDGHPDIVVANLCDSQWDCGDIKFAIGKVGVLLGNGDGTFQPAVSYSSGGYNSWSVAVADVNGDGHLDLIVANNCDTSDCNYGSVSILLGNGDGTFQPPVSYNTGENAYSVAVGDLRGNGTLDIVAATCTFRFGSVCNFGTGTLAVLLGNGDGTFQPALSYYPGGPYAGAVTVADLNKDGRADVVLQNDNGMLGVLLSNGDGTFQPAVSYSSPAISLVVIADVNRDGNPDLVVAGAVLLGNGDGTFAAPISFPVGGGAVAVGDVNGDANPDVALTSGKRCGRYDCGLVQVLAGVGDGTFQAPATYSSGCGNGGPVSIAIADFNGDSRPDVVAGNWGCDSVGVLLNNFRAKTVTAMTSALNPSYVGQLVIFTATVSSNPQVPDGQVVTFFDRTTALASVALAGGKAAYSTSTLSGKTHYIKAKFSGNTFFNSSSATVTQTVLKYATTTGLTSNPNPSNYGQTVTFTATVTLSGIYALTGQVKFWDGTTGIGKATLNGGVATLKKSTLAVGTHAITAQYLSDAYNDKSTSMVVNQVVQ